MNSISLYLWVSIEKYLGIGANGPATYAAVISKIHQVSLSAICNLVDDLSKISLIKEPGQDVKAFGSQVIEKTFRIVGYGSALRDITSIGFQFFVECNVLAFKLKSLQSYDIVYDDPTGM